MEDSADTDASWFPWYEILPIPRSAICRETDVRQRGMDTYVYNVCVDTGCILIADV